MEQKTAQNGSNGECDPESPPPGDFRSERTCSGARRAGVGVPAGFASEAQLREPGLRRGPVARKPRISLMVQKMNTSSGLLPEDIPIKTGTVPKRLQVEAAAKAAPFSIPTAGNQSLVVP